MCDGIGCNCHNDMHKHCFPCNSRDVKLGLTAALRAHRGNIARFVTPPSRIVTACLASAHGPFFVDGQPTCMFGSQLCKDVSLSDTGQQRTAPNDRTRCRSAASSSIMHQDSSVCKLVRNCFPVYLDSAMVFSTACFTPQFMKLFGG